MALLQSKTKIIYTLALAVGTSLVAYTNCSNKTFSVSNETMQRLLSEGSSIFINNDDTYTNSTTVNLTIENNSAKEMYVTNSKDCSGGGSWEPYSSSKVWTLSEKNMRTKAYIKFREVEGGLESVCTWDSIIHDDVPPAINIVTAAPSVTNSRSVSFEFTSSDALSGIKGHTCRDQRGQTLATCNTSTQVNNLQEGPGSITIVAEDNAGNRSTPLVQTWLADFTAPTVRINAGPSSISNQSAGTFLFSGVDNFTTNLLFECRFNNGAFANCNSPLNFNLPEGSHIFEVRSKDNAGNTSTSASFQWTIDLSAPTVTIRSGPSSFSNSTTAQFTFDGMDQGTPLTRFECRIDNGAFVNCNSPYSHSALAQGNHTFQVRGYDGANNVSSPAVYNWTIDTVAPQVTITSTPSRENNQTSATFQFVVTDALSGIQGAECRIDNNSYQPCQNSVSYNNLAEGSHTFNVRARDVAGNQSTVASFQWFVDLTPPVLSFVRTPSQPTRNPSAVFEMLATDNSTSPLLLECRLDNQALFSPCSRNVSLNISSDGPHTFSVRASDAAGNTSPIISHNWLLDSMGPAINFTSIPNATVPLLESSTVAFEVVDNHSAVATIQCGLNGQFASCPAILSQTFNTLTAGNYTFTVNAVDALGNSSSNSIQWTVLNNVRQVSQTVTVTQNNKADILIVIDNSGSMNPEQLNMAQRFATFIDQLSSLDWRIAIVTTDVSSNTVRRDGRFLAFNKDAFTVNGVAPADFFFIHSGMNIDSAKASFGRTIQRPANEGSGHEQGIAASLRAVQRSRDPATVLESQPNRDFFRPDAVLSVLVVTDANETNPRGTQPQNTPQNWISSVQALWPSKPFVFNSIVVRSGDSACLAVNGNESYGTSYESLSTLTGGIIGTVCAADYGSQLTQMGQAVVNLRRTVNLNCAPVNQNKNATLLDDVVVTLQSGATAAIESVSGQSLTLINDLPAGTHRIDYWCL